MQAEPVSADMADTVKEADTEESLETTPSPTALPEESMEGSEAPDNSENKAIFEDNEVVEDEVVVEDEEVVEDETVDEAESVKTEAPKTDTNGSKTNGSTNSGASNGSTTNKPADPTPTHTHNWKEHTVTEQVWVPNIVVVDDYEYQVVGRTDDVFICDCDYTTTNRDDIANHIKSNVLAGNEGHDGFTIQGGHDIIEEVKVGSHEEDHGHNETKTYVDYYYCDCGETKK